MIVPGLCKIEGFVKITDPVTKTVLVDKRNAIHYENISIAMAQTLSNRTVAQGGGFIYKWPLAMAGQVWIPLVLLPICHPMSQDKMLIFITKLILKL